MCTNLFYNGDKEYELLKQENAIYNSFYNGSKVFTGPNKRDSTSLVPYRQLNNIETRNPDVANPFNNKPMRTPQFYIHKGE